MLVSCNAESSDALPQCQSPEYGVRSQSKSAIGARIQMVGVENFSSTPRKVVDRYRSTGRLFESTMPTLTLVFATLQPSVKSMVNTRYLAFDDQQLARRRRPDRNIQLFSRCGLKAFLGLWKRCAGANRNHWHRAHRYHVDAKPHIRSGVTTALSAPLRGLRFKPK